MNRSTPGLSISKSIDGFLKFKAAEGLSLRTMASYEYTLKRWVDYIGDRSVNEIQASDLTGYMAWLRTEYKRCASMAVLNPCRPSPFGMCG